MLLLIDNYDSFTWNLVHYFGEQGATVEVRRNDALDVTAAMAMAPQAIVISPGPCDPDRAGISLDLIKAAAQRGVPLFGVCLGHQAIGQAFGGRVMRAPQPMHGKLSAIRHESDSVFADLPSPLMATRYHSLIVERQTLPECLAVTAWTEDGLIMGLRHRSLPIHGVQFHPESIATDHGKAMIRGFLALAADAAAEA
jgi:anthranilate synthase component 2